MSLFSCTIIINLLEWISLLHQSSTFKYIYIYIHQLVCIALAVYVLYINCEKYWVVLRFHLVKNPFYLTHLKGIQINWFWVNCDRIDHTSIKLIYKCCTLRIFKDLILIFIVNKNFKYINSFRVIIYIFQILFQNFILNNMLCDMSFIKWLINFLNFQMNEILGYKFKISSTNHSLEDIKFYYIQLFYIEDILESNINFCCEQNPLNILIFWSNYIYISNSIFNFYFKWCAMWY